MDAVSNHIGKVRFFVLRFLVVILFFEAGATAQNVVTVLVNTTLNLTCGYDENASWIWIPAQGSMAYFTTKRWTQDLSSLYIREALPADNGEYRCLDERKNVIKAYKVIIADTPSLPQNISCETDHSLNFMTCCWSNGPYSGVETITTLHYTLRAGMAVFWPRPNLDLTIEGSGSCIKQDKQDYSYHSPSQSLQCCDMPTGYKGNLSTSLNQLDIQIKSENVLGKAILNITELPYNWIRPIPPRNLRAYTEKNGGSYYVTASWESPNMNIDSFIYELRYRVTADHSWHTLVMIKEKEKTFEVRRSFSVVEIQVSSQPFRPFGGLRSEWTQSVFATTGVIAPFSRMRFDTVVSDWTESALEIFADWIAYSRSDEPGYYVEILLFHCNGNLIFARNATNSQAFFTASIDFTDCLKLTGSYCNIMGCSKAAVVDIRPHRSKVGQQDLLVTMEISNKAIVGSWRSIQIPMSANQCSAKIIASHREKINGSDTVLRSIIKEKRKVPCQAGNITVYCQKLNRCSQYYLAVGNAVVVNSVTYTRTYRSPFKKLSAGVSKAFIWNVTSTTDSKLKIFSEALSGIDCSNFRPRIYYKPINGSECSNNNGTCYGDFVSQPLNCENNGNILEKNVFGDTTYEVEIASCCVKELSSDSGKPICLDSPTKDIRLVKTPIRAPGTPINFRWLDTENLAWDPPVHKNGPITGYVISTKYDSYLENVTSYEESVRYSGLCEKNIKFNIEVAAFTTVNSTILFGSGNVLPKDLCSGKPLQKYSIGLLIGSVLGIITIVTTTAITAYYRVKMKYFMGRTIWPRVPRPNLNITLHGRVGNENSDRSQNVRGDAERDTVPRNGGETCDEIHTALLDEEETDRIHTPCQETCQIVDRAHLETSANGPCDEYAVFFTQSQKTTTVCESNKRVRTPSFLERNSLVMEQPFRQNCSMASAIDSPPTSRSELWSAIFRRRLNYHASLASIPYYLSCSSTKICSKPQPGSEFQNCESFGQGYEPPASETHVFFE